MLDLQFIRNNVEKIKQALVDLNTEAPIDDIIRADVIRREILKEVEAKRAERKSGSKKIGQLIREGKKAEAESQKERMTNVNIDISNFDEQLRIVESELNEKLLYVPNMPYNGVPVGPDESHNVVVREVGEKQKNDFPILPHWEVGTKLDIVDFERGTKLSGSRFYVLKGLGARLQRALITWMLDMHIEQHGC